MSGERHICGRIEPQLGRQVQRRQVRHGHQNRYSPDAKLTKWIVEQCRQGGSVGPARARFGGNRGFHIEAVAPLVDHACHKIIPMHDPDGPAVRGKRVVRHARCDPARNLKVGAIEHLAGADHATVAFRAISSAHVAVTSSLIWNADPEASVAISSFRTSRVPEISSGAIVMVCSASRRSSVVSL